jgi:PAS domain S-box-containing protein
MDIKQAGEGARQAGAGFIASDRQVRENHQAEEEHAQPMHSRMGADSRFRALVELAPDATVVTDHDGRITLVNRQTEVLFGHERQDLLGQPVELLIPARFRAAHQQHRAHYLAAPRTRPMGAALQLFGRRRDGSEFPVEVSLSPLDDDAGEFAVISSIRDVSELQRVEAARAAAEAAREDLRRLQAITDVALAAPTLDELLAVVLSGIRTELDVDNAAILLTSEDGRALTLYAAQGPEEAVAGQVWVPIGRGVAGRIAATRRPLIVDDLSTVEVATPLLRERLHALVGVPLLVGDRLIGVVHVGSASPRHFTDADVRLLQLVAERTAHAIDHAQLYAAEQSARREAETALAQAQANKARFRCLVDANIIGIVVVEGESIIEANGAFLRMLGYPREDLPTRGVPWTTLTALEHVDTTRQSLEQILAEGACTPFETEFIRRDGGRVPAVVGGALLEREPARLVAFVLDLTERKWLERQREEARAGELALREVNRHMEEFLATAAHDLRSPVTGALFGVELAHLRVKRLATAVAPPPDGDRPAGQYVDALAALNALEHASHAVRRLSQLISRLFDVAQARTGKLELMPAACDLAALVREHVGAQRALTPERTIRLDLPTGTAVPVVADADRLGQVLSNYLTNALKYSPPDRPVDLALETNENCARVTVRDEGPGLPPEEQNRVWEMFHRVLGIEVQGGASESLGLGLGLHICKTIVERHGGQVGVESVVGEGSTFWFSLPLARAIG